MKIFVSEQVRRGDKYTQEHEPISAYGLMTRAATECALWITSLWNERFYGSTGNIGILCGTGNNGGDGLVIAKVLSQKGYTVRICLCGEPKTKEAKQALLDALKEVGIDTVSWQEHSSLQTADLLIDALLGSGIKGPAKGKVLEGIEFLNQCNAPVISIDLPSGLAAEGDFMGPTVRASYTLVFEQPKLAFLLKGFELYAGDFRIIPIGISETFKAEEPSPYNFLTDADARELLPKPLTTDYKGTRGHVHIIGGGENTYGAPLLAAHASLRTGGGLVSVTMPSAWIAPSGVAYPDFMFLPAGDSVVEIFPNPVMGHTYAIGPGLGLDKRTQKAFYDFIGKCTSPVIIDADGINLLALQPERILDLPKGSVLTPHWGELKRLIPSVWHLQGFELYTEISEWTQRHQLNLLFKNPYTCVFSARGQWYFNSSGTVALATAGSGDVLTGIIARLLSQGLSPYNAAISGMWLHGKAGQYAAVGLGKRSVRAVDIIASVSQVLKQIER